MTPHAKLSKKRSKRLLLVGAMILSALIAACLFLRISRPRDVAAYVGMASECHPIWKQFAIRRLGPGDNAADLLERFPPNRREEFGDFRIYHYFQTDDVGIPFTGLSVFAKGGHLLTASAWSCTWQFSFFETHDPSLNAAYAAFQKEQLERLRQ